MEDVEQIRGAWGVGKRQKSQSKINKSNVGYREGSGNRYGESRSVHGK